MEVMGEKSGENIPVDDIGTITKCSVEGVVVSIV